MLEAFLAADADPDGCRGVAEGKTEETEKMKAAQASAVALGSPWRGAASATSRSTRT